ncbi:MAG: FIST N-terminal domain-containing protein [Candidatus Thiodiazotropha sp.]
MNTDKWLREYTMLNFYSASTRMANPQRAIMECLEVALGLEDQSCDLVIINASIGHRLEELRAQTRKLCPNARIVAGSCAGVVGREGVSESLKDVAIMAVRGEEFVVDHVDDLYGWNTREKAELLARGLQQKNPDINMVYLLGSGIDIANDQLIAGFESVFGPDVTLFGATTSDNMRGVASFQSIDEWVSDHGAVAVGFADPTLVVETQATHGFVAQGEPMIVTRAEGNRIIELNGRSAWSEYTSRLGLSPAASLADTIPIGAIAESLTEELASAYGNSHILRVVTHVDDNGALVYPTYCEEGVELWLTVRDEERIFSDLDRLIRAMTGELQTRKPVAVFQADCLARGRRLFNRIMKEELVQRMQYPFSTENGPPPWLGMYGFGEFARLNGVNTYHNYTTALAALYRI